jgi:hypothetical protein
MLEHLIYHPEVEPEAPESAFTPVEKVKSGPLFDAKVATVDVFDRLGVVDDETLTKNLENEQSGAAFVALIGNDEEKRLEAVGALTLPSSVRASVAMLSHFQWNFVAQAAELRSMAVSKIVAETDNPSANIRLRALQMLGNVTEVALFTERVEIKKTAQDPMEIEAMIREKLAKFAALAAPAAQEITDIEARETANG